MQTPQISYPKLSAALGINNEIWLKREDLHPYGSHKGHSIPFMINEYCKRGIFNFVISSSGNAALCALRVINARNDNKTQPLSLKIFVGQNIDKQKFRLLKKEAVDSHITIEQVTNPKQTALQTEKNNKTKWLRQSTDDLALPGYEELAAELSVIPNLAAIFIPTSSGTTALGLYRGFNKLNINPQIHIIQTPACHPMVNTTKKTAKEKSLASAIVDKIAHRKQAVLEAINKSEGRGWVTTNDEIKQAITLVKKTTGIDISPNSALAIAGLQQAIESGWRWDGPVVCLITGK